MTNKNTSYAENGEKVAALYNFARLDGWNKLNKKDAIGYVADHMKLSKAEVGRILNYEQERGEYVFSNKGQRELLKDEVYRAARSGADIETIANSYGISKSTARKYSHPTLEVAEAEVINDSDAVPIQIESKSYKAKPSQSAEIVGSTLDRAENSILAGLSRGYNAAYNMISNGIERGLNALSEVGDNLVRNAARGQRFTFAKEPSLAFASMGAATPNDPAFDKSSEESVFKPNKARASEKSAFPEGYTRAYAESLKQKEGPGFISRLADTITNAEIAMAKQYDSVISSVANAGRGIGRWIGRNARAAALSAAVAAMGIAAGYGINLAVSDSNSSKPEARKPVAAKTENASRTYTQAQTAKTAETRAQSARALTFPDVDLTEFINGGEVQAAEVHPAIQANYGKQSLTMPALVEIPGVQEPGVVLNRDPYNASAIAQVKSFLPARNLQNDNAPGYDNPVIDAGEVAKNMVIADVLNGATNDNVAALKAYLRTNPKDEGTAKLFKSAVKELKRSGNYSRKAFNKAYKSTVKTENLAPKMVNRFGYHLGNFAAKITPFRDAGRAVYQRDVENADTMNPENTRVFEEEFKPMQLQRAEELGIYSSQTGIDEANLRDLISSQMRNSQKVSLDDVLTTNFIIDSSSAMKKKYGSLYNNFAADKFVEFAENTDDEEIKSISLYNAEILSIRNPEKFKAIRKMREPYRWDVNEIAEKRAGEIYPTSVILLEDLLDAQGTHRRNIAGAVIKTAGDVVAVKAASGLGASGGGSGGSSGGAGAAGGAGGPAPHPW